MTGPYVFLDNHMSKKTRFYSAPLRVITAHSPDEVPEAFEQIDSALKSGLYVAGYGAYELGYALIDKLAPLAPSAAPNSPLLCFGVFEGFKRGLSPEPNSRAPLPSLTSQWSEAEYTQRFERLMDYIHAGDLYQANLTFPYKGFAKTAPDLAYHYSQLKSRQPVRYGGVITLGEQHILTLSPELFFNVQGQRIQARPMKGTAPRGDTSEQDAAIASAMQADEKSRAENLMIVDLLRNDLSRVSQAGSVKVTDLFSLETYPTLHQLTSGIEATLNPGVSVTEIFARLFPCGSVTGAPKIRAMEIIHELEDGPRGPYCGAIGYFDPNGDCNFNVAIRTLTSTPEAGGYSIRYPVGSGVVIDSKAHDEYGECSLKAAIIKPVPMSNRHGKYDLIETLRWEPVGGYPEIEPHTLRLMRSAEALGFQYDLGEIFAALDAAIADATKAQRIRLSLAKNGKVKVSAQALKPISSPARLRLSKNPLTPRVQITKHKVSARKFYDGERARIAALVPCDEVIFVNEAGYICEGSFTSLFVKVDDQLYTPPISDGLLPGILRAQMIANKTALVKQLTLDDLKSAQALYIGNSLRGLMRAKMASFEPY